jgi:hypothetical protein
MGLVNRGIPSDLHGAVETLAAPAIMAAPFLLGFGQATAAIAIAFGVVVLGLALSMFGPRRSIPLSAHAGLDYAVASFTVVAGLLAGLITGEPLAAVFLVGVGIAHMALTASTRFSAPRTAH